jgi:hypothetical protein
VAFLRTVVEPSDPVVGQQVTVTLLFYTRVSARNLQPEREISTDGFWVHDLIGPASPPPSSRREIVVGRSVRRARHPALRGVSARVR